LPAEIAGMEIPVRKKAEQLLKFHKAVYTDYLNIMDNDGNVLNKMKQFWSYFSFNFSDQHKTFKKIKKSNKRIDFERVVEEIFTTQH
jgi:hypothetical protein